MKDFAVVWFHAQYLYCFAERNEAENNLNCTLRQVTIQFFSQSKVRLLFS